VEAVLLGPTSFATQYSNELLERLLRQSSFFGTPMLNQIRNALEHTVGAPALPGDGPYAIPPAAA